MLVAYVFQSDLGSNKAGDVVQLDQEAAQPLVDAGVLAEATADDVAAPAEEAPADDTVAAVNSLSKRLEETLVKATEMVAKQHRSRQTMAPVPTIAAQPKDGPVFKSVGDMIRTIYKAKQKNEAKAWNQLNAYEEEMRSKAVLGMSEGTNADGGYTVNPEFSANIWKNAVSTINLLDYCAVKPATSKTYTMRLVNQSSLAAGSIYGGITVTTAAEGGTLSGSKPAFSTLDINLQKYYGFVYYTNELLADTSYPLEAEINEMVGKAFVMKLNTDLISSSASDLEGVLNTPSLITVTKDSGQTNANPVTFGNVRKMWGRMYPDSKANAVWLMNPELESALIGMAFSGVGGTTSAYGLTFDASRPFPLNLFGRPVLPFWGAAAASSAGDIILADMSQLQVYKSEFVVDMSRDVAFATDQVAFRFILRLGFKSPWRSTLTGPSGSTTYSSFICREALQST